ncbi:unnamed protein product [Closterium sp. NIES-64]|nr:unnamed protein product [Closterium sp. NIES-64]
MVKVRSDYGLVKGKVFSVESQQQLRSARVGSLPLASMALLPPLPLLFLLLACPHSQPSENSGVTNLPHYAPLSSLPAYSFLKELLEHISPPQLLSSLPVPPAIIIQPSLSCPLNPCLPLFFPLSFGCLPP